MDAETAAQLRELGRCYVDRLLALQDAKDALDVFSAPVSNRGRRAHAPHPARPQANYLEPYTAMGEIYAELARLEQLALAIRPEMQTYMLVCWSPDVIGDKFGRGADFFE
jgi:hypothetical protein